MVIREITASCDQHSHNDSSLLFSENHSIKIEKHEQKGHKKKPQQGNTLSGLDLTCGT